MRTAENLVTVTRMQWCQDKLRLPCVYRCVHTQRSKEMHDTTYCGSCRNIIIVYLYSQHDVVLLALRWEPQLGNSFIAFLPSSELYLVHWLDMQKGQNSPWSGQWLCRVLVHTIMYWMALHYPCEKRMVVLFSNYWDMNKNSTNSHVPMVRGWNTQGEHICRRMFDHEM